MTDQANADLVLKIRIRDYGVDTKEWDREATFFVAADARLVDRRDGLTLWKSHIEGWDAVMLPVYGSYPTIRIAVSAASLTTFSSDDLIRAFEQLADYTGDLVADRLQSGLNSTSSR